MKKREQNALFKVERKGYCRKDVEEFIQAESKKHEDIHHEQRERIDNLVKENLQLQNKIQQFEKKEGKIVEAIMTARENADKLTAEIKLRYMMELERLNLFRAKWTGAYEELKERYGFDGDALNVESVAISTKLEIERFLQRDFSLSNGADDMSPEESFRLETERLSKVPGSVNELKNKLVEAMRKEKIASSTEE